MRISRGLGYLSGGLLAVIIIIAIVAINVDYGRYKQNVETLVSEILGREFVINGPFHLTLGRNIQLSAQNLQLASTDWSSEPTLVSVKRVDASLNLWSLINGPIMIESLRLDGARINFEQNDAGDGNWKLTGDAEAAPSNEMSASRPSLPVLLDQVEITDVVLVYAGPDRPQPYRIIVDQLLLNMLESEQYQLTLEARFNEKPVVLDLTAGQIDDLVEFRNLEANFSGHLGEIQFDGSATIADLLNPSRPTARLHLSGPNIEYLTDILLLKRVTSGPLSIELSLAPSAETMQLKLSGDIGEFKLLASGKFVDLQQLQDIDLSVSASGPDTGGLAKLFGIEGIPRDPFDIQGKLNRSGKLLVVKELTARVGKTRLKLNARFDEFPSRDSAKVSLQIKGPDIGQFNTLLGLPGRIEGPFKLDADIIPRTAGGANISLTAQAAGINLSVDGDFSDADDLVGSKAKLSYHGSDLRTIAGALGLEDAPAAPFKGAALLERVANGVSIKDGSMIFDKDRISFSGLVGDEPLSKFTDLKFEAAIPKLRSSLARFGIEREKLPDGKFLLAGKIVGRPKGIVLSDTKASYEGLNASLSADISIPSIDDDSKIKFQVSGSNLSELLPADEDFQGLNKAFSLSGAVQLGKDLIKINDLKFKIDKSRLSANIEIDPGSKFQSARFEIEGSSPDINVLFPRFAEYSVSDTTPLKIQTDLEWRDGLLKVEKLLMQIGKAKLEVKGSLEGPPDFTRTNLDFDLQVADIYNFSGFAGYELPHQSGILKFHLDGDVSTVTLDNFEGKFGDSDIDAKVTYRSGKIPDVSIQLSSKLLNLTPYLPPDEQDELATQLPEVPASTPQNEPVATPQKDAGSTLVANERIIPDTPLQFDVLQGYSANIDLQLGEVQLNQHIIRDVRINGLVADGGLRITSFSLQTANGGNLSGGVLLEPQENGASFGMKLLGENLKLGLPAETAEDFDKLPPYDLRLDFITSGSTPREMAGALNGYLRLTSGEGRIKTRVTKLVTQDFIFELLNTINPFRKTDPYNNIKCTVVLAAVEDGQLVGKPVLVRQSDRLNIIVDTKIDLKTESLDMHIKTVPVEGLGISLSNLVNPFIKVVGTLANPRIVLDSQSVVLEGGAAVATGGISILALGLKDRFFSDKQPCDTALKNAEKEFDVIESKYAKPSSE